MTINIGRRDPLNGLAALLPIPQGACVECQIARNLKFVMEAGAAVEKESSRAAAGEAGAKWGSLHPERLLGSLVADSSAEFRRAADVVEKLTGDATSSLSATDLREEADGMDAAETLARRRNEAIRRVEELGDVSAATLVAAVIDVMDGVTR